MLLQHGLHPLQGMLSHAFDIFKKPFLLQALDCCQGRGACYWVLFVSVMSQSSIGHDVQPLTGYSCRKRENSSSESLANNKHIWHYVVMLTIEHIAGSAE